MPDSQHAPLLLVEDDPNLGSMLREYLQLKGFELELRKNGQEGLEAWQSGQWSLCILDVMLPRMDGFSLAREIRRTDTETPILFLTAKSMIEDKVEGFSIGGDDFLTKPFSMEELVMRIRALLRRASQHPADKTPETNSFDLASFHFDYESRKLKREGKEKKLTTREAELLRLLCLHRNQVLRRGTALRLIWGDDSYFNGRSMDVFITRLRKLLGAEPAIEIQNVHGTGFKLVVMEGK